MIAEGDGHIGLTLRAHPVSLLCGRAEEQGRGDLHGQRGRSSGEPGAQEAVRADQDRPLPRLRDDVVVQYGQARAGTTYFSPVFSADPDDHQKP